MDQQNQQVAERIRQATNILVTVNSNPSVDQLAACIGLTLALNKFDKHGTAVFSGQVPSTIEFLKPEDTLEQNTDSLRDFIISLDKSKADKLRYKVEDNVVKIFITPYRTSISQHDLVFSQGDFNVDAVIALGVHEQHELDQAITAHGRILHDATVMSINTTSGAELGAINWTNGGASSLSELVVMLIDSLDDKLIDQQIATALLTGIVAETERFSNSRTSSFTMSVSARLLDAGANQQLVATKLEEAGALAANNTATTGTPADVLPVNTEQPNQTASDGTLEIEHEAEPAAVAIAPPAELPVVEQPEQVSQPVVPVASPSPYNPAPQPIYGPPSDLPLIRDVKFTGERSGPDAPPVPEPRGEMMEPPMHPVEPAPMSSEDGASTNFEPTAVNNNFLEHTNPDQGPSVYSEAYVAPGTNPAAPDPQELEIAGDDPLTAPDPIVIAPESAVPAQTSQPQYVEPNPYIPPAPKPEPVPLDYQPAAPGYVPPTYVPSAYEPAPLPNQPSPTLTDLEHSVQSPHLGYEETPTPFGSAPTSNDVQAPTSGFQPEQFAPVDSAPVSPLDEARSAVEATFASPSPADQPPQPPIEALNAMPINLDIQHPDQPSISAPPSMPPLPIIPAGPNAPQTQAAGSFNAPPMVPPPMMPPPPVS